MYVWIISFERIFFCLISLFPPSNKIPKKNLSPHSNRKPIRDQILPSYFLDTCSWNHLLYHWNTSGELSSGISSRAGIWDAWAVHLMLSLLDRKWRLKARHQFHCWARWKYRRRLCTISKEGRMCCKMHPHFCIRHRRIVELYLWAWLTLAACWLINSPETEGLGVHPAKTLQMLSPMGLGSDVG